jgi:hypothetical protein
MATEESFVTPLKRKVSIRFKQVDDDVWDTEIVYLNQISRVGKFKGKDHAREAAITKAIQVADAPAKTGKRISSKPHKKKKDDLAENI